MARAQEAELYGTGTAGGDFVAASPGTSPEPDSPGNAAWQRTRAKLAQIHAELDAQRRRN